MNKVTRKERVLKALADRVGFSEQDVAWLTKSLDPFHDVPVQHLAGYPDGSTGNTLVQTIKKSFTLERSLSLTASPTWGAFIKFDDHLITEDCIIGELEQNAASFGSFTNVTQYGGITQVQFTSSSNLPIYRGTYPTSPATATNVIVPIPQGSTNVSYLKGRSRVIARGFEIHNTTAEIAKQGTITAFEMPSTIDSEAAVLFAGSINVDIPNNDTKSIKSPQLTSIVAESVRTSRLVQLPPSSVAAAVLLPKSVQWEAKDGAMVVQTQNQTANPMTYRDYATVLLLPDETLFPDPNAAPVDVYLSTGISPYTGQGIPYGTATTGNAGGATVDTYNYLFPTNKRIPYSTTGVILSGLSNESTFTVNWIEVIERAPGWSEVDLIVLASPSLKMNPMVLELYSKLVPMLPVAVPVQENGLGDWFVGIVDSVVNTISSIGKPLMGAIKGYQDVRNETAQDHTYQTKPTTKSIMMSEGNKMKSVKEKKDKPVLKNVPKMPQLPVVPKQAGK